jgi:hypothetical protein
MLKNPWARTGNHTGFAVWLYEAKAWLGAKKEIATRRFQTYREEDFSSSLAQRLRTTRTGDDRSPCIAALGNSLQHTVVSKAVWIDLVWVFLRTAVKRLSGNWPSPIKSGWPKIPQE